MGKHLKMYGMKFGGGIINSDNFSKVLEYSRGDASRFTRNVINIRMGNHKFNLAGGLKDLKTYFADTEFLKKQVINPQIESIKTAITERLQSTVDDGINTLTDKAREKLESALEKISKGQNSVNSVSDDNDFNAQNIQQAKKDIAEGAKEAAEALGSSVGMASGESININATAESIKNKLNYMRKISMDQYEEQYSAELCIKGYTHYQYTKTLEEMCAWTNEVLSGYGITKKCVSNDHKSEASTADINREESEQSITQARTNVKFRAENNTIAITEARIQEITDVLAENQKLVNKQQAGTITPDEEKKLLSEEKVTNLTNEKAEKQANLIQWKLEEKLAEDEILMKVSINSLEAFVKDQLTKKHISYTTIEFEKIYEFDETLYDPD